MTRHETIVRAVFDAYRDRDRTTLEALLADGFTFTNPYDDTIDKRTYFARCWPESERISEHILEEIVGSGERLFVLCLCRTRDGREFRNVGTFDIEDGRIRAVNVYFGASPVGDAIEKQD